MMSTATLPPTEYSGSIDISTIQRYTILLRMKYELNLTSCFFEKINSYFFHFRNSSIDFPTVPCGNEVEIPHTVLLKVILFSIQKLNLMKFYNYNTCVYYTDQSYLY
jgi:hypothetical protein